MQATRNRFFVRLLIIVAVGAIGVTWAAGEYFNDTLPAALAAFVKAGDDADLTSLQAATFLLTGIALIAWLVGMAGLWWCRRWARWVFTVSVFALLLLEGIGGFVDPTTLVSNFVATMFNSALNMSMGAILALIWLGMSADFEP